MGVVLKGSGWRRIRRRDQTKSRKRQENVEEKNRKQKMKRLSVLTSWRDLLRTMGRGERERERWIERARRVAFPISRY